jgi:hypothetical protein
MTKSSRTRLLAGIVLILAPWGATGAEPKPADVEFFEKSVRPLLVEHCLSCHGGKKQHASLRLDSRGSLLKGGDSGPAVVPGEPDKSLLLKAVRHEGDSHMPPKSKLPPQAIQALAVWVKSGAPWPDDATATKADPQRGKNHWAFQPLREPPVPQAAGEAPSAIDRFILAKLAQEKLQPVEPADRRTLIRRATFDLTGLPPTPEEVTAALNDASPDWFATVVDRLLASPHYGERWGRHWLDVVRYADTAGNAPDFPIPQAYRYRNYVIRAFNQDVPYDQFLREQIAGDLLAPNDRQEAAALAKALQQEQRSIREAALRARTTIDPEAKGALPALEKALGHDEEAVRLAAVGALVNIDPEAEKRLPAVTDLLKQKARVGRYRGLLKRIAVPQDAGKVSVFADHGSRHGPTDPRPDYEGHKALPQGYWVYVHPYWYIWGERQGDLAAERFDPVVATGFLAIHRRFSMLGEDAIDHYEVEDILDTLGRSVLGLGLSCARCHDHKFDPIPTRDYYGLFGIFQSTRFPFPGAEGKVKQKHFVGLDKGQDSYAVSEGKAGNAAIQRGGDPAKPGPEAPRGFLEILGNQQLPTGAPGSGRRQLADWLTDARNPLAARVLVNRLWLHHFGQGLVRTPNDFGVRGQPPTHPELLDYLASRFIEGGWSIKHMHRLIMLSRAYQLASAGQPENSRTDPNNLWLWKFPRRRLDAESLRDALLAVSGELDRTTGEAHPFPPADKWNFTQHTPFNAVYETNRRSVYLMQQRLKRHPFLALFDGADPNASTPGRGATTTPVQALFWMNDPFVHQQADQLAKRLIAVAPDDARRAEAAYQLLFARPPSADEAQTVVEYLAQFAAKAGAAGIPADRQQRAAWASLSRALLSSNEFLYLD